MCIKLAPRQEEIKSRINEAIDKTLFSDNDGSYRPFVCVTCDRFLKTHEINYIECTKLAQCHDLLKPKRCLPQNILNYYTYNGKGSSAELKDCLLSPKSCYLSNRHRENMWEKFVICRSCRYYLNKKIPITPKYAICNSYEIGIPPKELLALTDIELAFISEVRVHSHLLCFTGGHKGIKGWHSLLKTNIVKKRQNLEQLDRLTFVPDQVLIVLYGGMSANQKQKVLEKCHIRRGLCKIAIDWLLKNHRFYSKKFVNLDDLPDPIILDKSTVIESLNNNIELQEEFTVVFPDATLDETTGGYKTINEYKQVIDELSGYNFSAEIQAPESEYVKDFEGNNFTLAFPLQFPYGYGGPEELRQSSYDGRITRVQNDEYIKHVTNLSNIHFQKPLFTLVAFNILQRQKMVKNACYKLHSKKGTSSRIADLTPDAVIEELKARNAKVYGMNSNASEFLNLVTAMTKELPHTDEASKKGRRDVLSMQAKFGFPDVFFTIAPPDDNSFVISVYSGFKGIPEDYTTLTEEELNKKCKEHSKLRFNYPGLSTFNFESILTIVIKEIVGWNNENGGVFGIPDAYFYSVEEQARKTLHVHVLIWLKTTTFNKNDLLGDPSTKKFRDTKIELCKFVDEVASTQLIGEKPKDDCFSHKCQQNIKCNSKSRYIPALKSDQELRYLRHKEGCIQLNGKFVYCNRCTRQWTATELTQCYIINKNKIKGIEIGSALNPVENKKIFSNIIYRNKVPRNNGSDISDITNAVYNVHSSTHVTQCFKNDNSECKHKFPKKPNKRTRIEVSEEEKEWYSYRGINNKRRFIEIIPARSELDVCMNTFSPVVSQSKLACNSNVTVLFGSGPASFYVTKYTTKKIQDEDHSAYEPMIIHVQKRLIIHKFDQNVSESMSRLISACLAHNSKNVISATMAKFLINNNSRFGMSHIISYVPVQELKAIIENESILLKVSTHINHDRRTGLTKTSFVEAFSFHYLLRPKELENHSSLSFYTKYRVIKEHDDDNNMEFCEGHPGKQFQYVKKRDNSERIIPGINNWEFIDTGLFKEDILNSFIPISKQMEDYAKTVLVLLYPFRRKEDLMTEGSYTLRFREVHSELNETISILQNLQDIRNATRYRRSFDDLEKVTTAYEGTDDKGKTNIDTNLEYDDEEQSFIHSLLIDLETQEDKRTSRIYPDSSVKDNQLLKIPQNLSLDEIRRKGAYYCGYKHIINISPNNTDEYFIETETPSNEYSFNTELEDNIIIKDNRKLTIEKLASVLIKAVKRKVYDDNSFLNLIENKNSGTKKTIQIQIQATGTVESLKLWSNQQNFDTKQRKAFLIIMSHFILSYMYDTEQDLEDNPSSTARSKLRVSQTKLKRLAGKKNTLRMFLNGAGGSGKSEVLKEVLKYAREFCYHLDVPFMKYTILFTASTGVAATLINGDTVHTGCFLYKKTEQVQRDLMKQARLIIVDEVSMIDITLLKKLDTKLRTLREADQYFGGINMVFVGDFRQLEPVKSKTGSIYTDLMLPQWMDAINCYIECEGTYRFQDDPEWGEILSRFREGNPISNDFRIINDRVVQLNECTKNGDPLPSDIAYATPNNKERDAINTAIFAKYIDAYPDKAILIFSDNIQIKENSKQLTYHPLANTMTFWESCGEDDCKFNSTSKRMDPVLKLYPGCQFMLVENHDVSLRLANGTHGKIKQIMLKPYQTSFPVSIVSSNGSLIEVKGVFASQVSYVLLEHMNDTEEFKMIPKNFTFITNFPRPFHLSTNKYNSIRLPTIAHQVPIIINNCTTGHKLQGSTKKNIFIDNFTYKKNWPYVVLSRVKSRKGLFLRRPLDESMDYSADSRLVRMLQIFRESKQFPDEHYSDEFLKSL